MELRILKVIHLEESHLNWVRSLSVKNGTKCNGID